MSNKTLQKFDVKAFREILLKWYAINKRDLPWRKTTDPYKIWVSEIMLQQTKVDTVIPYYEHFMSRFPTIYELADADLQVVLKAWEGLGYYSRAENLHDAVREVVATYDGEVPAEREALGDLRGIGPYTQGAILSIAFNKPEPAVDGNVMRVLSRVLMVEENISKDRVRRKFEEYIRELICEDDPASFNQSIMELGALICTPRAPQCILCPVMDHCRAFAHGMEEALPIRNKSKQPKTITYIALLIKNNRDEYLIEQRPEQGLLAHMWQFPMVPTEKVEVGEIENWFQENYGLVISLNNKKGEIKHVFSHLIWDIDVYTASTNQLSSDKASITLVSKENFSSYPFPVSHLNMMKYL